jgi:hypothetical protein
MDGGHETKEILGKGLAEVGLRDDPMQQPHHRHQSRMQSMSPESVAGTYPGDRARSAVEEISLSKEEIVEVCRASQMVLGRVGRPVDVYLVLVLGMLQKC